MGIRLQAALVMGLAGLVSSAAQADVLWDQSAINLDSTVSMPNWTKTSGIGQREAYGMTDVTVPAGGWTIQSISIYVGTLAFNTPTTATLNIFPKTGALPTAANNPRLVANGGTGVSVPVTVTSFEINGNSGQFANDINASGLSIALAAGDYWIGLAPRYVGSSADNQWPAATTFGSGQAVRFAAPLDAAWTDTAALFGNSVQEDGAIKISGVPTPGAMALLGLGGLLAGRRRR